MFRKTLFYGSIGGTIFIGFASILYMHSEEPKCMRESPLKAYSHQKTHTKSISISTQLLVSLQERGYVVIDNVLSPSELKHVRHEINKIIDNGKLFKPNDHADITVRKDQVYWISESIGIQQHDSLPVTLLQTLRIIRSVPYTLNGMKNYDEDNMGVPLSNQLSCHDGNGSNYIAHRDKPENPETFHTRIIQPGLRDRKITIILYLNDEKWDSKVNGGNLRLYLGAESSDITGDSSTERVDIEPFGGRMVIFDSSTILHEVLPSHARRIALTCWVGGQHSKHSWMRVLCIPLDEINIKEFFSFPKEI